MQTRHRTGIEYKDIDATQMRATNDRLGIIEGLMNRIGNIDYQKDRAHKGNWVNTIKAAYARKTAGDPYLVPFLWSHNFDALPPGGVFYLDETKEGLFGKVQFNLDIQSGAELYASYRAGTVSKQSVGYKCLKCDYTKGDDGQAIRELKECELLEYRPGLYDGSGKRGRGLPYDVDVPCSRGQGGVPELERSCRDQGKLINDYETCANHCQRRCSR